jgi:GT2 family glycosyltransferase
MNVFVIVVTYDGSQWIEKCLYSLQQSSITLRIIVIDNNSSDNTVDFIKENYPEIYLIENKENIGFGKANNIGLKYALQNNADYVFLLNQDAYVMPRTIEKLCQQIQQNPEYGILSPIHLNGTEKELDYNFSQCINVTNCPNLISDFITNVTPDDKIYPIKFVNAALWIISKDCLNRIGGFCPLFPHYGEDNDYVTRLIYHHLKIGIYPLVFGVHNRSQKPSKMTKQRYYIYLLIVLCNVNFPISHCFVMAIGVIFKAIFKREITLSYLGVYFKILYALPQIINHRKIAKNKEIANYIK